MSERINIIAKEADNGKFVLIRQNIIETSIDYPNPQVAEDRLDETAKSAEFGQKVIKGVSLMFSAAGAVYVYGDPNIGSALVGGLGCAATGGGLLYLSKEIEKEANLAKAYLSEVKNHLQKPIQEK